VPVAASPGSEVTPGSGNGKQLWYTSTLAGDPLVTAEYLADHDLERSGIRLDLPASTPFYELRWTTQPEGLLLRENPGAPEGSGRVYWVASTAKAHEVARGVARLQLP
jgi:hypothetical protein